MHIVSDTGWIDAGAIRIGALVRVGLVWPADPGVAHVTARCDIIPSEVSRSASARELQPLRDAPYYETIEWITVEAAASGHDVVGLELGYATFR
jgi:hypothetical protein